MQDLVCDKGGIIKFSLFTAFVFLCQSAVFIQLHLKSVLKERGYILQKYMLISVRVPYLEIGANEGKYRKPLKNSDLAMISSEMKNNIENVGRYCGDVQYGDSSGAAFYDVSGSIKR